MEINNKNFSGIPMGKDLDKCIPTETSVRSAEHTGKLNEQVKDSLLSQIQEEGVITVHCSYYSSWNSRIRIWNSTFLIDKATGMTYKLIHALNISFFPIWMELPDYTKVQFTLFFSPLPKSCKVFDLLEDIYQSGGFEVESIERNNSDVYFIQIN